MKCKCDWCGAEDWFRDSEGQLRCRSCETPEGEAEAKRKVDQAMQEFATGAVRGTDVLPRYDLTPTVGIRRMADASAYGVAKGYPVGNWLKGISSSNLLNHALAHLERYRDGDRSEDHLGHALWNVAALAHNEERRPDMHDIMSQREVPAPKSDTDEASVTKADTEAKSDLTGEMIAQASRPIRERTFTEEVREPGGPEEALAVPVQESSSPSGPVIRLEDIVRKGALPDGTPVQDIERGAFRDGPVIYGTIRDDRYRITEQEPGVFEVVESPSATPWAVKQTARCWEIEEILGGRIPENASLPSGPVPGLAEPATPQSPADEGWAEWKPLVERVQSAGYEFHRDEQGHWFAKSPQGDENHAGRGPVAYVNAYLWAERHRILAERRKSHDEANSG